MRIPLALDMTCPSLMTCSGMVPGYDGGGRKCTVSACGLLRLASCKRASDCLETPGEESLGEPPRSHTLW